VLEVGIESVDWERLHRSSDESPRRTAGHECSAAREQQMAEAYTLWASPAPSDVISLEPSRPDAKFTSASPRRKI
jgi:hypothetical protein